MPLALQDEIALLRLRVAELEARLSEHQVPGQGISPQRDGNWDNYGRIQIAPGVELGDILATLPQTLLVIDYDWRVVFMNVAVQPRRQIKVGDVLGDSFWAKWPDMQGVHEQLKKAMRMRTVAQFEYYGLGEVWSEVEAFPCHAGLIIHSRDITHRKHAELAQAALAAIIASSDDAIISKDLNGIVQSWNAGAERILGYSAEEMIGKQISRLAVPGHEDELPNLLERLERGERIDHYRTKRKTKDGRIITVSLTLSPIKDSTGKIVGASKVARDVTESERSQKDLLAANVALRRANADLEQFSSAAAHDLQEPLRMVAIYSQLLKRNYEGQLDAQADEYIKYCVEGALKMQALVRDLLAYTRATTPYDENRPLVNLNQVVSKAIGNLEAAVAESGASIIYDSLPQVRAHERLMQQLFQNLISNALKYRNKTVTPIIRIAAVRHASEWVISVNDNGIGIKPEYQQQIFGLFKRLHTSAQYPGTGLGLAICFRIVERYGGRIWVESEFGKGATFLFTLPDQKPA